MSDALRPFHLAIPVDNIADARRFYTGILGCRVGRESAHWIDFNFFGHQVTAHLIPNEVSNVPTNPVDGEAIPVRHFGIVLRREEWQALVKQLEEYRIDYVVRPTTRFKGEAGEQATLFIADPSGNVLEFKAFRHSENLFATK
ncbi:MAG: VOC family protein [Gammaproteobacteria bacterium]